MGFNMSFFNLLTGLLFVSICLLTMASPLNPADVNPTNPQPTAGVTFGTFTLTNKCP